MYSSTNDILSQIKNKIKMIYKDMYKLYKKDIDETYLIYSRLKEIMTQFKTRLKKDI